MSLQEKLICKNLFGLWTENSDTIYNFNYNSEKKVSAKSIRSEISNLPELIKCNKYEYHKILTECKKQ